MATNTRMFVPYRYQPGYVTPVSDMTRSGWQYCLLIDAEIVVRDTLYEKRSDAVVAMVAEVNELNYIYGNRKSM